METARSKPDWYCRLREWLREPSPTGTWLYRGQALRYGSVVPSILRGPNRHLYGNRLYAADDRVARDLLLGSPVLAPRDLQPDDNTSLFGTGMDEGLRLVAGARFPKVPLSFGEVVRALAQHYGFPTLFVDLTLDPEVAAFFAAHEVVEDRYQPREDEPSQLLRWPARRLSPGRLLIPGGGEDADREISAIDLSGVSPHFRRPHNQSAVLAKTVFDPWWQFRAYPLSGHPDELEVLDLARLDCCDRCELPPGAGRFLRKETGATEDLLFPDRIDLGYPHVCFIALLSMVCMDSEPPAPDGAEPTRGSESSPLYRRSLKAARSVLARECFRLVPGCRPALRELGGRAVMDAAGVLAWTVETACEAARLFEDPDQRSRMQEVQAAQVEAARRAIVTSAEAWNQAVESVVGKPSAGLPEEGVHRLMEFEPRGVVSGTGWILPEIDRRWRRVEEILDRVEAVPAWAFENVREYREMRVIFESPPAYRREVQRQLRAHRARHPDRPPFPPWVGTADRGGGA